MSTRPWGHSPTYVKSKGRFKAYCSCGRFQSPMCDTIEEVVGEYKGHTKIKEREVRPKG